MPKTIKLSKKMTMAGLHRLEQLGVKIERHGFKLFAIAENAKQEKIVYNLTNIDALATRYYFAQGEQ